MHAIASNLPIDLGRLTFNLILALSLENTARDFLPFGLLIIAFWGAYEIDLEPHEMRLLLGKPISRKTLLLSNAHLGVAPPPPRLRPHAVETIPSGDETPPPPNDGPSASAAAPTAALVISDPSIIAAITTLVVHMDTIHKDLVEHIGLVHEQEFITDVNNFIQSIRRH
ncbi:hypothetical protein Acr_04g0004710 [Actinidia rufa]|uniref:Uncharacterized protein n=1 Tax=Actinidia rufa TaxID=165716 RepID=A0A7J0EGX2_9ERIC|nr:hypothetical protein Acr_04g0004710 [Actinidia rufa]